MELFDIQIGSSPGEDREVQAAVEELEVRLYEPIRRAGEAKCQAEYERYYDRVFRELDRLDEEFAGKRYILGDTLSRADVYLYSLLVKFDLLYFYTCRLNRDHIWNLKNLWRYENDLHDREEFSRAADLDLIKREYYLGLDETRNPYHLVPNGPEFPWRSESNEAL